MEEVVVNDFWVFSVLLLASMFLLGFLLGKIYVPFAFGSTEEPRYSFQSGNTLEETIKKIEAVVKENAYLKKQLSDERIDTKDITLLLKIDFSSALKEGGDPFYKALFKKLMELCPTCRKPNEIFIDELCLDEKLETIYKCQHCGNDADLKAAILAFSKEAENNQSQTEYAKRLKITGGDVKENKDYKVTGLELQQTKRLCVGESLNLKLCNTCCFSGGCKTEQNIKDKYHLLNYGCSSHLDYIEKFNLEFEISKELKQKEQKQECRFLAIVKGNDVPNNWKNTTINGDIIIGSAMRDTTNEIDDMLNQLGIDEDDEETLEKIVECAVAILSNNTKFISESVRINNEKE